MAGLGACPGRGAKKKTHRPSGPWPRTYSTSQAIPKSARKRPSSWFCASKKAGGCDADRGGGFNRIPGPGNSAEMDHLAQRRDKGRPRWERYRAFIQGQSEVAFAGPSGAGALKQALWDDHRDERPPCGMRLKTSRRYRAKGKIRAGAGDDPAARRPGPMRKVWCATPGGKTIRCRGPTRNTAVDPFGRIADAGGTTRRGMILLALRSAWTTPRCAPRKRLGAITSAVGHKGADCAYKKASTPRAAGGGFRTNCHGDSRLHLPQDPVLRRDFFFEKFAPRAAQLS